MGEGMGEEMSEKKINPMLKTGLEMGPIVAFFVAYLWLREKTIAIGGTEYEGFIIVTAGFVPLMMLTNFALWRLTGKLSKMQIATLVLVVVFGGLSIWFNDERFFKMKPTIIYMLFAGILGVGLLTDEIHDQYDTGKCLSTKSGLVVSNRRQSSHQDKKRQAPSLGESMGRTAKDG